MNLDPDCANLPTPLLQDGFEPRLQLAQLGPEPDAQAVRHAMVRHPSGLGVLAAPTTAIPFEAFDVRRIGCMLDALVAENDVVIVDLPPALIDWLEPLL